MKSYSVCLFCMSTSSISETMKNIQTGIRNYIITADSHEEALGKGILEWNKKQEGLLFLFNYSVIEIIPASSNGDDKQKADVNNS